MDTLEEAVTINATPAQVWAVVSDVARMGEFSPYCIKTWALGPVREGARAISINRYGWKYYPASAKIVRLAPAEVIAWTAASGAIWSYTLEPVADGTKLIERRELPHGPSVIARTGAPAVWGSADKRDTVLADGMRATLAKIKQTVEAA